MTMNNDVPDFIASVDQMVASMKEVARMNMACYEAHIKAGFKHHEAMSLTEVFMDRLLAGKTDAPE